MNLSTVIFQKYKTVTRKQTFQFPSSEVELHLMGPLEVGASQPFYLRTETDPVYKMHFFFFFCILEYQMMDKVQHLCSHTGFILDCHHVRYTITISYNYCYHLHIFMKLPLFLSLWFFKHKTWMDINSFSFHTVWRQWKC